MGHHTRVEVGGGGASTRGYSVIGEDATDNGGKGGDGTVRVSGGSDAYLAGGGAGNPGGTSNQVRGSYTFNPENGTGGLLIIYANSFINNGSVTSNGSKGGYIRPSGNGIAGGGSSGGGSINIFYSKNYSNNGEIIANGVDGLEGVDLNRSGGIGGNGSISIGNISTGTYVEN